MIEMNTASTDLHGLSFNPASLVDLLVHRATYQPDHPAYIFLIDGDEQEASLTYRELDRRARAIAAQLQQIVKLGDRVLLLYPPGLDYIAGFFGCQYAGAVAVPLYPPRLNRNMHRVQSVAADSQATVALTVASVASKKGRLLEETPSLKLDWLSTDQIEDGLADSWRRPHLDGDTLSFLQYTSGSTSAPKGVMVSHGNLLHNEGMIKRIFRQTEQSVIVSWLPLHHDMGLIGGVLQPLYAGTRCILMLPTAFLQRPISWLRAISRYRASTSGGPNFAYDLCVRKIGQTERETLDLSTWSVAFNGAEPIRADTLRSFTDAFAPCGFRPEAFHPCYGLAEATLIVSGKQGEGGPVVKEVLAESLAKNRVAERHSRSEESRPLVSSGRPVPEQKLVIAHPESLTRCLPDEVGEVWISGPSVAQGYWNGPEKTDSTFRAFLSDTNEGPFLRTGDLGFVINGELFITGRLKDMMIIRGINYYPQDIEITAQQVDPALRQGCGAAFSVEAFGAEQVVMVQEIQNNHSDMDGLIERIRQSVVTNHDINLFALALIKPGSLPKTSSGKIQRGACRDEFLSGNLSLVKEWRTPTSMMGVDQPVSAPATTLQSKEEVEAWLVASLAQKLGLDASSIDVSRPISSYGVDSLMAINLTHGMEEALHITMPVSSLLEGPNIAQLAAAAVTQKSVSLPFASPATTERGVTDHPLSIGQQALWFLHQLSPLSTAYNIATAVRFKAPVKVSALQDALRAVTDRHPSLRTLFVSQPGGAVQRVQQQVGDFFKLVDATNWSEAALDDYLAKEANSPFDLEQGPLLRVTLFKRASQEHLLLFVAHHIILDFWSFVVIAHELGLAYAAERAGTKAELPPLACSYADYVHRQREMMAGPRGEQLRAYWHKQLAGALPILNLPGDRPLSAARTDQGSSHAFRLSDGLTQGIKSVCRFYNTTLYVTLLAAFQTLLYRYTYQEEILVGSPMACRDSADLKTVVGYFTNPVVLRSRFSPSQGFRECLLHTRQDVFGALAHQDYPFALLVESLHPAREPGRSPLFQVMFTLQKSHLFEEADLASFMLGEDGAQARLGELSVESVGLRRRAAQFDLSLMMAEADGSLAASLVYNTDLFDHTTMLRMEQHFRILLEGIALNPEQSISLLPMLSRSERDQLLIEWNDTHLAYPEDGFVHRLFEAQVDLRPEAIAVGQGEGHLSYSALNSSANRLAYRLRALGVGPETMVGICMPRSIDMVVALLAVLKAGGAYVPMDSAYPKQRLAFMAKDAGIRVILTEQQLLENLPEGMAHLICLDREREELAGNNPDNLSIGLSPDNLAYVIYTSGSTGQPKGVMISHSCVVNFFAGMDRSIGCGPADTLLAVTSISFDISVLELFWTLTRGCRVVLLTESETNFSTGPSIRTKKEAKLDFSLFYFAADESTHKDKYRLLFEGAKFADRHGFEAVWTPERHFHPFGGLYPNPSVISAALASITERVRLRAGSVVLPLHHPVRVAEEWSLVDNLSNGRVDVAFASGWHADDFVFFPGNYADRKQTTFEGIEIIRKLWRGEAVTFSGGAGNEIPVEIYPKPVQRELPIWITAAGSPDTFLKAGEIGANVLTHLLGQRLEDVVDRIRLYRDARSQHGYDPQTGKVTLMLHTFVAEDGRAVRNKVRVPFTNYLKSSVGLIANFITSMNLGLDLKNMRPEDMDDLLAFAFDRYFETSALFGTPSTVAAMIDQLKTIGVDEVACLVDFGVEVESALAALPTLREVKEKANAARKSDDRALRAVATMYNASMMQCTPSMMSMLMLNAENVEPLKSLRVLLLGGEALPLALAKQIKQTLPARVMNMYGPTETTIWSATSEIEQMPTEVRIGKPIANTQIFILNWDMELGLARVPGQIYIGGAGLARAYWHRPGMTAERFVPNPFAEVPGARLYQTGDLGRYGADGQIEFLGRADYQVKIRGHRIELGEIEEALQQHTGVREAVVLAKEVSAGDARLVAYVVAESNRGPEAEELRGFLKQRLPDYMVPSAFMMLDALPLTLNGKVDRKSLLGLEAFSSRPRAEYVGPRTKLEKAIEAIWREALKTEKIGIYDNFFDLGGHSLLASQLISKVRKALSVEVSLKDFFDSPTVAGLAVVVEKAETNGAVSRVPKLVPAPREKHLAEVSAQGHLRMPEALKGAGS